MDEPENNIIIPSVALKDIYEKRQMALLNNPKQLYNGKKQHLVLIKQKYKFELK